MILCKVFFDDATQPASSSGYKYICAKHRESPSASLLGNSQRRFFSLSSFGSPPRLLSRVGNLLQRRAWVIWKLIAQLSLSIPRRSNGENATFPLCSSRCWTSNYNLACFKTKNPSKWILNLVFQDKVFYSRKINYHLNNLLMENLKQIR